MPLNIGGNKADCALRKRLKFGPFAVFANFFFVFFCIRAYAKNLQQQFMPLDGLYGRDRQH
jgi:hypothetical protein